MQHETSTEPTLPRAISRTTPLSAPVLRSAVHALRDTHKLTWSGIAASMSAFLRSHASFLDRTNDSNDADDGVTDDANSVSTRHDVTVSQVYSAYILHNQHPSNIAKLAASMRNAVSPETRRGMVTGLDTQAAEDVQMEFGEGFTARAQQGSAPKRRSDAHERVDAPDWVAIGALGPADWVSKFVQRAAAMSDLERRRAGLEGADTALDSKLWTVQKDLDLAKAVKEESADFWARVAKKVNCGAGTMEELTAGDCEARWSRM